MPMILCYYYMVEKKLKSMTKINNIYRFKQLAALISISFFFFAASFPASAATSTPYDNLGMSSAVLNASTGKFIAGKNENQVLPVASLTKLMTALVLLDLGTNFNTKVVITEAEVEYTAPYIAEGDVTSKIDLEAGDTVTKNDLWHAMLIASSNEAAAVLVNHSGVSMAQFVRKMNAKAKTLGLHQTKFTEPSGIDPKNVSTAKEMAIIARKAYAKSTISKASRQPSYKCKELVTGRKINIYSRNNSLLAMKPVGMKVGYLTEAKMNAAIRLNKAGKDRVVVILHAANNSRRNKEINRLMASK